MALLETNHLGVVRGQQGRDTLLSDGVDVVVHRHACGVCGRHWHIDERRAVDGGHGRWLRLLLRRLRGWVLDVLWVVRSTWYCNM